MAISFVAGAHTIMSIFSGPGTTSAINTVGADFIGVGASYFADSYGPQTISDNYSNSYTSLTSSGTTNPCTQLSYCYGTPTVGSAQTFSNAGDYATTSVAAFSGVATSSVLDTFKSSYVNATGTSLAPGSITPAGTGELFLTVLATMYSQSTTDTIDSSFIITDQASAGGQNYCGGALAYFINSGAGAENPTWSFTGPISAAVTMATFAQGAALDALMAQAVF